MALVNLPRTDRCVSITTTGNLLLDRVTLEKIKMNEKRKVFGFYGTVLNFIEDIYYQTVSETPDTFPTRIHYYGPIVSNTGRN